MIIGYARVSTQDQSLDLQLDALQKYGCDKIYTDHISGDSNHRPGLARVEDEMFQGDKIVVWKLDRLSRRPSHLFYFLDFCESRGVHVISLSGDIDLSTAEGRLHTGMSAVLSGYERDVIKKRTLAGLQAARDRGAIFGRPVATTEIQDNVIRDMRARNASIDEIAEAMHVSRRTIYRRLKGDVNGR